MPTGDIFNGSTNGQPTITRTVTKHVVPFNTNNELVDPDSLMTKKHEEWTTSKKTVNHKTKQVETRVQRQLILEDGRVVADSGPQVTTKTKEDNRVEESENSDHKTTGDDNPGFGYTLVPGSAQVVSEKTESTKTMTETKEENKQMHDERIRDLSGEELHHRIIVAPDDTNFGEGFLNFPGTLTHYSCRSQKVVDQDEVKEVSQIKDGELATETTRTHHHEEAFDDEVPEDEAEEGMVPERSAETSRKIQYYDDPKEFESAVDALREESRRAQRDQHRPYIGNNHVPAVTHKWLDDHFGKPSSPFDDVRETTRTRSGGNRITIEMTGHRSSPSDLSPTDSLRKHDLSRDSTLRHKSSFDKNDWTRHYNGTSPSPPYPSSSLSRTYNRTTSPPYVVTSPVSSRSKTPVKTFYLGEDNTYNSRTSSKTRVNKNLSEILKSNLSLNGTNHHITRSDSYRSSPRYGSPTVTLSRSGTFNSGPIYSNIRKSNSTKKVQVTLSDDEDEYDRYKTGRNITRERSLSPQHLFDRNSTTLPRHLKTNSKSLLIPISTPSKHYKSSESLLSPNYSNYSSTIDYGSTKSFNYRASPINYSNHSTLRNNRRNDDWLSSSHNYDSYSTTRSNKSDVNRIHSEEKSSSTKRFNGSGLRKHRIQTSPPESGYQSPLPLSPPTSPPPRLIKISSDHYGSPSSMSPPVSPHHMPSYNIKKSTAYPCGSTSRSKSSGDLRSGSTLLPSPTSFTPLSSPLEIKTMGQKTANDKYYRVKPGDDGRSVVVQVRDWQNR